ncbi:MAG: hypothetical protein GF398_19670 [Chitinivibrionales bacterium]|nr:hypothetical protein [Chitinivibrionales bacterium]
MRRFSKWFYIAAVLPGMLMTACFEKETVVQPGKTDTLTITKHDTLYNTDTVTVYDTINDTAAIPIGKPFTQAIGIIYGDYFVGPDTQIVTDSFLTSLTIYSNPQAGDYEPAINNRPFNRSAVSSQELFGGAYSTSDFYLGAVLGANYELYFAESSDSFQVAYLVGYYADSSAATLAYDTLRQSISYPANPDTVYFGYDVGSYDSSYYFVEYDSASNAPYRISQDRDLRVYWPGADADWYLVQYSKYDVGFRGPEMTGSSDTLVTDTQVVIAQDWLFQDTLDNTIAPHDFILVSVASVNGPSPDRWSHLPSFGEHGLFFAARANGIGEFLLTSPYFDPVPGLAKSGSEGPRSQLQRRFELSTRQRDLMKRMQTLVP